MTHVGKESNSFEDVQSGLVEHLGEVINEYDDFHRRLFKTLVAPTLRQLGIAETARRTGFSKAAVSKAQSGKSRPHRKNARRYLEVAATYANERAASQESACPAEQLPLDALRLGAAGLEQPE